LFKIIFNSNRFTNVYEKAYFDFANKRFIEKAFKVSKFLTETV